MKVYARAALVPHDLPANEPALLLEGSWPQGRHRLRWSLDECIDARHAWIDLVAQQLADEAGVLDDRPIPRAPNLAWLQALALRYYLVRLLRPICFFQEILPGAAAGQLQLAVHAGRDEDYAHVLGALAQQAGGSLHVVWHAPCSRAVPRFRLPFKLPSVRPLLALAAQRLGRHNRIDLQAVRVLLCGSPRVFDPLCPELLQYGASLWWLHERFPCRCWWRWRNSRIVQLACDSPNPTSHDPPNLPQHALARPVSFSGIDLTSTVERWLASRAAQHGAWHQRLLSSARQHVARVRPHVVLLDEDATPFKRAIVAMARRVGATSAVVQHGAECVRFGFVPLAADYFFAWSAASRDQLLDWGAPAERVLLTDSPLRARALALPRWPGITPRQQPCVLLAATVPPREHRPDSVALHLTPSTFHGMLHALCTALERCAPGCTLVVKPHPRTHDDAALKTALLQAAGVRVRWTRARSLAEALRGCHLVVSMFSTAGLEAAAAGWPVIQLLPAGSANILPANLWGMLGSARTAAELEPLLRRALAGELRAAPFAWNAACARPLAQAVLQLPHLHSADAELAVPA